MSTATTFLEACQRRRSARSGRVAGPRSTRTTTRSEPTAARRAARPRSPSWERSEHNVTALLNVMDPLLDFFSHVDVVFGDELDALSPDKRKISLGRVYDAWKRAKKKLDPEWKSPSQQKRMS